MSLIGTLSKVEVLINILHKVSFMFKKLSKGWFRRYATKAERHQVL